AASEPQTYKLGSVGKVMPFRDVCIIDGKLAFRGAGCFYGYQHRNQDIFPFNQDDYFITQDLAHFDSEKNLFIDGRADHIVISGGEDIKPVAIEQELITVLNLHGALVVPIPDQTYGTLVCAYLGPKESINEAGLLHFNQSRLSHLKLRHYRFDMPKGEGKV